MPELFNEDHAVKAIQTGVFELFGEPHQLGIKTLNRSDPQYRCYYDNSMGYRGDLAVCGGWSYHNVRESISIDFVGT